LVSAKPVFMLFLQSAPHPALQRYIGQYIYVSFNTAVLPSLKQTFLPYDIPAISFFIGPVFLEHTKGHLTGPISALTSQSAFAYYNALTTAPFSMYFTENTAIKTFVIPFKPAGFWALFRRDISELTNLLPDFSLIAGASEGSRFLEQLVEAADFAAQVSLLDQFFLRRVPQDYNSGDQVREACRRLMLTDGLMNMKDLAYHTNLSLRTMERQFTERVGVAPKTFARFKRFHHALKLMNREKPPSWADIAFDCGYYDQAHFNKEFKAFSHQSPSAYSPQEYALYNQIVLYRNFTAF
jgi:AraC-like DNA-binding protein